MVKHLFRRSMSMTNMVRFFRPLDLRIPSHGLSWIRLRFGFKNEWENICNLSLINEKSVSKVFMVFYCLYFVVARLMVCNWHTGLAELFT